MISLDYEHCNKCGWVHFTYTRKQAQQEVDDFNRFYDQASEDTKQHYGGRSTINSYEKCFNCGNHYTNFSDGIGDKEIQGVTLQPKIARIEP